jgi:hypothetical protein
MRYKGLRNANKHRCDIPPGHPLIIQSIQSPKPCGGSMAKTLAENSKLTCTSGITCAQEREYGTDWLDGMPKYSEPPKRTRTHSHTTHSSRWKIGPLSPLHTHVIALPAPECLPPLCWPLVFSGDQIIIIFLFRLRETASGLSRNFTWLRSLLGCVFRLTATDRRRLDDKINKIREFGLAVGCAIRRKKLVRSPVSCLDTIIAPPTKVKALHCQSREFLPTLYIGCLAVCWITSLLDTSHLRVMKFLQKKTDANARAEFSWVRLVLFSSLINFNNMLCHCSGVLYFNKWKHSHMASLIK